MRKNLVGNTNYIVVGKPFDSSFDGGANRLGRNDGPDNAVTPQSLFQEVKTLRNTAAVSSETAAYDSAANILQQRILDTRQLQGAYPCILGFRLIRSSHIARIVWVCALALVALALAYLFVIARQIRSQAEVDEARPADVIIIMGAAEYRGRPSPVLKARLDHGLNLYRRGLAPRILTTGGAGGDPVFTEGEVGRAYLVRNGVPSESILLEAEGESTMHSTAVAGEIMRRMNLNSCIVVSDAYHIFRVKKMLEFRGLNVYGSPRPSDSKGRWQKYRMYGRQAFAYALWRIGITI